MNYLDWGTIAGLVAVAGFLWRLTHTLTRDMNKLETRMTDKIGEVETRMTNEIRTVSERVARIEGALFYSLPNKEQLPKS